VAQLILQRVLPAVSPSEKFTFANGTITCGQRLRAIAREVFRSVLTFAKQRFEEGKSCQRVLEVLMPVRHMYRPEGKSMTANLPSRVIEGDRMRTPGKEMQI